MRIQLKARRVYLGTCKEKPSRGEDTRYVSHAEDTNVARLLRRKHYHVKYALVSNTELSRMNDSALPRLGFSMHH